VTLSRADRDRLPAEDFAVPGKRLLPISDAKHVAMARGSIDKVSGITADERSDARLRIRARADTLGMNTADWDTISTMRLEAMALDLPDVTDHPNRMPFSGVLVKLDQPSCAAPHGSKGKLINMSAAAAEAAIGSLLGMGVGFTPDFDGHDAQRKIGVITAASVEGSDLLIEGHIYAADFPKEAASIKADKDKLGFSFEAQQIHVENFDASVLVITACVFTGAALLKKDKAAYTTTSLAASAAGDIEMTKEELEQILAAALGPINDKIATIESGQTELGNKIEAGRELHAKVAPAAEKVRAAAEALKGAGVGMHASRGHVAMLNRMADNMEAEAMAGSMPQVYRDFEYGMYASADDKPGAKVEDPEIVALRASVETLTTKLADSIAAARDGTAAPERKTLTPAITTLLAKAGVEQPEEGKKIAGGELDRMLASQPISERLRLKSEFRLAGLID
jgi:hypothetical protein